MSSAVAAAVAADLATAAAAAAATLGRNPSPAAHLLPDPVSNAVPGHGRPTLGRSSGGGPLRLPQLLVPELTTSQAPAEHERYQRQQPPHPHRGPPRESASAAPAALHQHWQHAHDLVAVPEWARSLPPEVQAELLRAIATAHMSNAQQHGHSAG